MATPIGRLTKKTQCQLSASVSSPPASRPSEPPATDTNTYALIARARSAACGNSVTMIARITDAWAAAPTPWSSRAPISAASLGAMPHSSEAAVKVTRPARKTRLRPSEVAEPAGQQQQAAERDEERVDDPGQVRLAEAEVAAGSTGSATFTIVTSSTIISCAKQTTIERGPAAAVGDGWRGGGGELSYWIPLVVAAVSGLKWRPPPK